MQLPHPSPAEYIEDVDNSLSDTEIEDDKLGELGTRQVDVVPHPLGYISA